MASLIQAISCHIIEQNFLLYTRHGLTELFQAEGTKKTVSFIPPFTDDKKMQVLKQCFGDGISDCESKTWKRSSHENVKPPIR